MGKRSDFERLPRDFYPTPYEAVMPLIPHLLPGTAYIEPCAGNGALIEHLDRSGLSCLWGVDIEPQWPIARVGDARTMRYADSEAEFFITNPPWDRKILHPIIENLSDQLPTWLLFDADWMHTKQAAPFMDRLRAVVSVGRLKWIPDSKMTGKDNCCWYLFGKPDPLGSTVFYGRRA